MNNRIQQILALLGENYVFLKFDALDRLNWVTASDLQLMLVVKKNISQNSTSQKGNDLKHLS